MRNEVKAECLGLGVTAIIGVLIFLSGIIPPAPLGSDGIPWGVFVLLSLIWLGLTYLFDKSLFSKESNKGENEK